MFRGDAATAFVPDWLKCERFRDSIWSYIPKVLAESAVKTEHKKDDIVELAVAWAPKDYSGANWNALLFRNFVNRALDESVESVEGEVYRAAVNLGRHDKYGRYKDKLAAAVSDIKMYARAMRLYDFLREMKQIRYAAMLTDGQIATGTHVAPKCTGRFLNTDTMFSSSGNIVFEEFKPLGIEHRGGYVVLDINSQEVSPYYRMRESKSGYNLHFFLDDEMRVSTTMGFLSVESKLCGSAGQGYYTLVGYETEFTTNDTARSLGYGGFSVPDVFFGDDTQPCKFCANVRFSDLRPLAITPQVNDGLGRHPLLEPTSNFLNPVAEYFQISCQEMPLGARKFTFRPQAVLANWMADIAKDEEYIKGKARIKMLIYGDNADEPDYFQYLDFPFTEFSVSSKDGNAKGRGQGVEFKTEGSKAVLYLAEYEGWKKDRKWTEKPEFDQGDTRNLVSFSQAASTFYNFNFSEAQSFVYALAVCEEKLLHERSSPYTFLKCLERVCGCNFFEMDISYLYQCAGVAKRLHDKITNFANSLNNPRLEGFTLKFFDDVCELSRLREERCSINVLPRQGMMLLLSPADTKLWNEKIKSGLPATLGGLSVTKAHRELRKFLRLPW